MPKMIVIPNLDGGEFYLNPDRVEFVEICPENPERPGSRRVNVRLRSGVLGIDIDDTDDAFDSLHRQLMGEGEQ